MADAGSDRASGLHIGRAKPRTWRLLRTDSPVPAARVIRSRAGHELVRDQVGFPHLVELECPPGLLSEPAKLRLMKAFSLGVERLREAGRSAVAESMIRVVVDPAASGGPTATRGPVFTLSPKLLGRMNRSMAHLRAAVFALVESSREKIAPVAVAEPSSAGRPQSKVLLFRNIFTKDVGGADALQINPGVHYLISSLQGCAELVLLDAKLPLQDVCEQPPLPDDELAPEQFLTDPPELERALADHPDLNLVCLTLLERSFGQVRSLCRFIRGRSDAFIAVGGVFPTVTPEHAFAHLPEASFIVRGDGEPILPTIVEAVAGRTAATGLDEPAWTKLRRLEGVLVRCGSRSLSCRSDQVNRVSDLDDLPLDFSFLDRQNVAGGLSISTSRGCVYCCHFCSVMDRHLWRGKSADAVVRDLEAYERRLVDLYGAAEAVPETARHLQIWDDDFFLEPERAAQLMGRMVERGFRASFIQGTVSSFFLKEGSRITRTLNEPLLDAIPDRLLVDRVGLKLGTESFCDPELKRLGKPYDVQRIRALVLALAARNVRQEHFRILCNRQTSLDDLLDNFETLTELRFAVGPDFFVLAPSWLINLFPTPLYQACQIRGTDLDQPTAGALRADRFPEFDYPFVVPERPERHEVFEVVRRFPAGMHFGAAGKPAWMFDGVHGPDDEAYLRIYDYLRRALEERLDELRAGPADPGERYRIEQTLATRLGAGRWVPDGALRRVAPRLDVPTSEPRTVRALARYVEAVLQGAVAGGDLEADVRVAADTDGVIVDVEQGGATVRFLVQRLVPGVDAAFCTENLAFIARSSLGTEAERQRASAVIEAVRHGVSSHDVHLLD
ncbi:MAG: cobalamin-dependent protein [Deltaproteobacteria bacterium]|jgi:hypothetical protein|nr:cobalamin-dependent protein [Deltaproteobacteria bacterium]MBW2533149.1 cobalamin-dependent protein [Deltaproteobacteria bacterium]